MNQIIIVGQHERVDGDLATSAALRRQIGLFQDSGVQPPGMDEQPTIDARGCRAAIGDHDDLFIGAAITRQQLARELKPLLRVGMFGANVEIG